MYYFKKIIFILMIVLCGCATWDQSEIAQDKNGNNYWIKEEAPTCEKWRKSYKEVIPLANTLYSKSNELSYNCLVNGPHDEGATNEPLAIDLYKSYLMLTSDSSFTSQTYNKCFGSESYSFYYAATMDAIKAYVYSLLRCSTEMARKFEKAETSSDYLNEVDKFLIQYHEKFKATSGSKN